MNVRLKAAREASGKTQKQVAKQANISCRGYQDYEISGKKPGVEAAIRIADALGVKTYRRFKEIFGAATPQSENDPDGNPTESSQQ